MNQPNPEFDRIIQGINSTPNPEYADPYPYGIPEQDAAQHVKTGLTPRGKAAICIGGAVIACGTLFVWQHYNTQQQANEVRAQEFAVQQQKIQLEMQKELNKANRLASEQENTANSERTKQIKACMKVNQELVGKQLGVTYQSVMDDCHNKYPAVTDASMQAAGSTSDASGSGESGNVNPAFLVVGGAVLLGAAVTAKKNTRSNPA